MDDDRLFEEVVSKAGDAIVVADPEGDILFWNRRAAEMFGYTEAEAVGESLDLVVPEPFRDRHWAAYDDAMERGSTTYERGERLSVPATRKDGGQISVEFTVTLVRDADGELVGIAAILRDVTDQWERRQAREDRIEELEERIDELEPE